MIAERSIRMRDAEVRAILLGRKTMIRRPVKLTDGTTGCGTGMACLSGHHATPLRDGIGLVWHPYGGAPEQPMPADWIAEFSWGSRLWVKEVWARGVKSIVYRADFNVSDGFGSEVMNTETGECVPLLWQSSKGMPRETSRLRLEITEVRVERLQNISEADAKAEGANLRIRHGDEHWSGWGWDAMTPEPVPAGYNRRDGFRYEWEMIRGLKAWTSNPWVWVISFRRISPTT